MAYPFPFLAAGFLAAAGFFAAGFAAAFGAASFLGAGAGATLALVTGKKDIKLGAETPLKFELAEPVTINVKG